MGISTLLGRRRSALPRYYAEIATTWLVSNRSISVRSTDADLPTHQNTLGAYETPIDKMLSLPPQRATFELVPDRGAEPRPDGL